MALMELQDDARALAHAFAEETPVWNDDVSAPLSPRSKSPVSTLSAPRESIPQLRCPSTGLGPTEAKSVPRATRPRPASSTYHGSATNLRKCTPSHINGAQAVKPKPGLANAVECDTSLPTVTAGAGSLRCSRHAEELPEWIDNPDEDRNPPEPSHTLSMGPTESDDEGPPAPSDSNGEAAPAASSEPMTAVDEGIEIVWPSRGGKVSLKAQRPRVRAVARDAIGEILASICLKNASPEGPEKQNHFAKHALIASAGKLGFSDIVDRLKSDREYAKALGTILTQWVSTFRGRTKMITDPLVATAYNLESGDEKRVEWLKDSLRYIYPGDFEVFTRFSCYLPTILTCWQKGTVEAQKAFSPPIFVRVLRSAFFNNSRSIGNALIEKFVSSDPSRPDEKELPAPMLALVSTAIFASIADYEFDVYDAAEFSADSFADSYAENMRLLEHIKMRGPKKYHLLMHHLLASIRGAHTHSIKMRARSSDPLGLINLDDMEED
ncbi:hypothetical protein BN946_scf185010.g58 [Trametes cinnabarina]|uniref:DUF6532 domain-containing protein n=1 Tax=Pycnoporus cinnabarinus TaxID=5643 RepID=A0A060SRN7_PYCCI|nr:hypothetical protein BN946_scf185010.g58 [Trametes cinnabarina]